MMLQIRFSPTYRKVQVIAALASLCLAALGVNGLFDSGSVRWAKALQVGVFLLLTGIFTFMAWKSRRGFAISSETGDCVSFPAGLLRKSTMMKPQIKIVKTGLKRGLYLWDGTNQVVIPLWSLDAHDVEKFQKFAI